MTDLDWKKLINRGGEAHVRHAREISRAGLHTPKGDDQMRTAGSRIGFMGPRQASSNHCARLPVQPEASRQSHSRKESSNENPIATHAAAARTIALGGDLRVNRMGFGSMRLTGPGIWGEPQDPEECRRVLRRAVQLGVTFIDTADSYGPHVAERSLNDLPKPALTTGRRYWRGAGGNRRGRRGSAVASGTRDRLTRLRSIRSSTAPSGISACSGPGLTPGPKPGLSGLPSR